MSRELLGEDSVRDDTLLGPRAWREAPTDLDGAPDRDEYDRDEYDRDDPDDSDDPDDDGHRGTRPTPSLRPRRLAAAGMIAGTLGAVLGWSGSGLAIPAPVPETTASQTVWAVVHTARPAFLELLSNQLLSASRSAGSTGPDASLPADLDDLPRAGPSRALTLTLDLTLVNQSPDVQTVVALTPAVFATGDVRLDRLPVTIAPYGTAEATARIPLRCTSPLPLDLPGLVVADPGGTRQSVPVVGAAAVLAATCIRAYPLSALTGTAIMDGDRLRVSVSPTGGRSLRVVGIEVGGVVMDADPVPRPLDGYPTAIWLTVPASCDPRWRLGGIPQQVVVVVEGLHGRTTQRTRARIPLPIGPPLSTWLLEGPCRAG